MSTQINVSDIINELVLQISQYARDVAVLKAQVKTLQEENAVLKEEKEAEKEEK